MFPQAPPPGEVDGHEEIVEGRWSLWAAPSLFPEHNTAMFDFPVFPALSSSFPFRDPQVVDALPRHPGLDMLFPENNLPIRDPDLDELFPEIYQQVSVDIREKNDPTVTAVELFAPFDGVLDGQALADLEAPLEFPPEEPELRQLRSSPLPPIQSSIEYSSPDTLDLSSQALSVFPRTAISKTVSASPKTVASKTLSPSQSPSAATQSVKPAQGIQFHQYDPTKSTKRDTKAAPRAAPHYSGKPAAKARKRHSVAARTNVIEPGKASVIWKKEDASGNLQSVWEIWGKDQTVRREATEEDKQNTRYNRKHGACEKCRMQKLKCIQMKRQYTPCAGCLKVYLNDRVRMRNGGEFTVQPCVRIEILGLPLHRKGPTKYSELDTWLPQKQAQLEWYTYDSTTRELKLTQGFGEGRENSLRLMVSRFEPGPGDRTTYFWTDEKTGLLRSMEMPPYFISDMDAAKASIVEFLRNSRSVYIDTLLGDASPITRHTFESALRFSAFGQSKLVSLALDTWVAARFIESHWRVFEGGEEIGAHTTTEPGHPYDGFIPVTPIMDTQLDNLVIADLLAPMREELLKRLKAKIDEKKRSNWLEIYLTLFVMMSNTGWIIKDMIAMTTWKGLKMGNRGGQLTRGYIHANKSLLSYFHYACSGSFPLTIPANELTTGNHNMTGDQIEYMAFVQQQLSRPGSKHATWKNLDMYKDDEYWTHQLLCKDWEGDAPYTAGPIDDFTEDDFLSSSTT
ncbi:hypothetical protein QBC36DRAFT_332626 [Triangularia setosa]|uniref:Zn(2)-C6 fungal-type domain-containing protein n=1 Tax=Triangularia setosa TaxID=2587417 RepID=A0AAN6W3U1_9PEZI|nr:hypothetical protein QBC36DRAFT_332626 [Podospora setosa]